MEFSRSRKFICAAAFSLALSGIAAAQDNASSAPPPSAQKKDKPKKTWTEDDLSRLHSPADTLIEQKQAAAQKGAQSAMVVTPAASPAGSKEPPPDKPPLLSDPKTVDSAEKMIAWEDKDIAAQQEYVEKLKAQLASASIEDQEPLRRKIAEREKIVADTQRERAGLALQRDVLQKKATAPDENE
jgi:hypothetical protein